MRPDSAPREAIQPLLLLLAAPRRDSTIRPRLVHGAALSKKRLLPASRARWPAPPKPSPPRSSPPAPPTAPASPSAAFGSLRCLKHRLRCSAATETMGSIRHRATISASAMASSSSTVGAGSVAIAVCTSRQMGDGAATHEARQQGHHLGVRAVQARIASNRTAPPLCC